MSNPTARAWLVERGLAKPGRGKFSNVAKAALREAMDSGITFVDFGDSGAKREETYEVAPMTHPTGTAQFIGGPKTSMKNACNGCGYSLYWCECHRPRVFDKEVRISVQ